MTEKKEVISILVDNQYNVLSRISSLIGRRGFNIDSLSVGETQDPRVSRITVQAAGDDYVRDQLIHQLEKLHDCLAVEVRDA